MKPNSIFFILTFFLAITTTAFSQSQNYGNISFNKAVNISGKQRMLSQKMSKAYILMAKGIENEDVSKELNSSKFIFQKQLEILTKNATSSAVKLSIKNVKKLWTDFKELIESQPDYNNSVNIMKTNTKLLRACHELVLAIEASSNYNNQFFKTKDKEITNIINRSGKQRMLSQRLCLYYTASSMFPNKKSEYGKILDQVYTEFDNVIGDLLISNYNTTEIEEEIGSVMSMWEKFQSNKKGFINGVFNLEFVFNTTNELTKSFNKITGIYEEIAKN